MQTKFKKLQEALQAETPKLVAAARTGDVAQLRPAVSAVGKVCNDCHDAFRSKYLARMTEFSDRLFLPDRFLQQVSEIGRAIRPSIELEGTEWLPAFDQVASGRAGIVPWAANRAASVRAELEKGDRQR